MKSVSKTVQVELVFDGIGRVLKSPDGIYTGGVMAPKVDGHIKFNMFTESVDEDGVLNPPLGGPTIEGAFQINVIGDSIGYRELGKYFIALAELDTSADSNYHEHFEDVWSYDKRTHLNIIIRKTLPK